MTLTAAPPPTAFADYLDRRLHSRDTPPSLPPAMPGAPAGLLEDLAALGAELAEPAVASGALVALHVSPPRADALFARHERMWAAPADVEPEPDTVLAAAAVLPAGGRVAIAVHYLGEQRWNLSFERLLAGATEFSERAPVNRILGPDTVGRCELYLDAERTAWNFYLGGLGSRPSWCRDPEVARGLLDLPDLLADGRLR
jgi:hypothetical protein